MRTESVAGHLKNEKDGSHVNAYFEKIFPVTTGSDGLSCETVEIVGCKLADGTEMIKTDSHGNQWSHPEYVSLFTRV